MDNMILKAGKQCQFGQNTTYVFVLDEEYD